MAYDTYVDTGDAPAFRHPNDSTSGTSRNDLTLFTNITGAVVSVALVAGIGIWGYKLMMRDVTGIPIVRATGGDMRVRPENPGGELARNTGLAVNTVAATGAAETPAEKLVLAPQPVKLMDEDMPINAEAVAIVQQAIADQKLAIGAEVKGEKVIVAPSDLAEAAEAGSVDKLVAILTDEPAQPVEAAEEKVLLASATGADIENALTAALQDTSGLAVSLRPKLRPAEITKTVAVAPTDTAGTAAFQDIDPATLPSGTRLVQLGAFDDADQARLEWDKFSDRFADLMAGKDRVMEQASSGGRSFYRLRAMGFEDLADARRFCSAVVSEGGDCIPVVTR